MSRDAMQITVGTEVIQPATLVCDLGVYFDADLPMRQHVARIAQMCFYHLRRLRIVRQLLGQESLLNMYRHSFPRVLQS
jgi:hypothetical protein